MVLGESAELTETLGRLHAHLAERQITVATAESCTGGLIAGLLTHHAGSSAYFLGGVVAYANAIKTGVLGVEADILARHGAVSRETALAMVSGAARLMGADVAVSVTGIAGPGGGTAEKPVGTVWYAWQYGSERDASLLRLEGSRLDIRTQAALAVLRRILALTGGGS